MTELCFDSAVELRRRLRTREVSAVEVLDAHLKQIERLNPALNAICTLDVDGARRRARELDRGPAVGALHGMPIAIKDLELTKGMRTTFGSPVFADFVPEQDALFVERLRAAGAVILGKTNTPELGAGSQTFNPVFGATRNPYDTSRTCGGSSGGAAVAVATGMLPFADGSDLGGSVRNPPSFCNVFGLRPSPGRVPRWPELDPWNSLNVIGPIARSAADAALLLSALAGPDPRAPLSIEERGEGFETPLERDFRGARIAFSPDLGSFPVARDVLEVVESAVKRIESHGCRVELAQPSFEGAEEAFQTLRAHGFALAYGPELEKHRAKAKDTVVWNIEKGMSLTGPDVARAQRLRGALYQRVQSFMEGYELLLLPVTQVAPFSLDVEWVREIEGVRMESYIDWMKSCYFISLTALPAASVPAGFTRDGLPVGLQVVGRYRDERSVLQFAQAVERILEAGSRRAPLALDDG